MLGVECTATEVQIKKAFRALAHTHHPDKGGDAKKFQEINQAYQVLSNSEKRAQYDRFGGRTAQDFQGFGGFGTGQSGFGNMGQYTHFTYGGAGQRFTMPSLKKVPFFTWVLLAPFILLIACVGMIFLAVMIVRTLLHKVRA